MRFLPILLIPIITAVTTLFDTAVAQAEDIVFSISSDKTEYSKKDPINITLKLKNIGKDAVYVNRRFYINSEEADAGEREVYFNVYFDVASPSAGRLPCKEKSDTGLPRTDMFVLLGPGEETSADTGKNIRYLFDFNQPGTYEIEATYQNSCGEELGLDTFKDKVSSGPIKIKITE